MRKQQTEIVKEKQVCIVATDHHSGKPHYLTPQQGEVAQLHDGFCNIAIHHKGQNESGWEVDV